MLVGMQDVALPRIDPPEVLATKTGWSGPCRRDNQGGGRFHGGTGGIPGHSMDVAAVLLQRAHADQLGLHGPDGIDDARSR